MKNFFLIVGKNGTFEQKPNTVSNSIEGIYTTPKEVDDLFSFLEKSNTLKMAIHFHGGLVSQSSGIAAATKVSKAIQEANAFPVAFIWKTGLIETIEDRITESQSTEFFRKLKKLVIKKAAGKIGGRIGTKGIDSLTDQELDNELKKEEPFEFFELAKGAKSVDIYNSLIGEVNLRSEIEAEIEADIENFVFENVELSKNENPHLSLDVVVKENRTGEKGIISTVKLLFAVAGIIVNVIQRYSRKTDHGLYATVVEEIYRKLYIGSVGQEMWGTMKLKAKRMWSIDSFPTSKDEHAHVGSYFLYKMNIHMQANPSFVFDLIGHSAGSIVICELLNTLKNYKDIRIRNVVFLAPACLSSLFHPKFTDGSFFTNFFLFTMKDDVERKDRLVPGLYPHSLLYFVSGLLEASPGTSILGMERYFNRDEILRDYFKTRQTLSITTGSALNSSAEKHGDFDDNDETLNSITSIIK